jgi:hypothetical protein
VPAAAVAVAMLVVVVVVVLVVVALLCNITTEIGGYVLEWWTHNVFRRYKICKCNSQISL